MTPAVLAIVVSAVLRVGGRALHNRVLIGLAVAAFVALALFRLAFPLVIAAAALFGLIGGRLWPAVFVSKSHGATDGDGSAPIISDDALHGAVPSWRRAIRILTIGAGLWSASVLVVLAVFGSDSVFVEQAGFFSGTAVVTFGGAYAVLAYIAQRAVYTYGWLAPGEMVRGLAMAETTPGP